MIPKFALPKESESGALIRNRLAPFDTSTLTWSEVARAAAGLGQAEVVLPRRTRQDLLITDRDGELGRLPAPIAERGELSPTSRTSVLFHQATWPAKPGVVADVLPSRPVRRRFPKSIDFASPKNTSDSPKWPSAVPIPGNVGCQRRPPPPGNPDFLTEPPPGIAIQAFDPLTETEQRFDPSQPPLDEVTCHLEALLRLLVRSRGVPRANGGATSWLPASVSVVASTPLVQTLVQVST